MELAITISQTPKGCLAWGTGEGFQPFFNRGKPTTSKCAGEAKGIALWQGTKPRGPGIRLHHKQGAAA